MAEAQQSPDPVEQALVLIAEGKSIRQACAQVGVAKMTLWDALNQPEVAVRYARARELQAEHDASRIEEVIIELLDLARSGKADTATVMAYRSAADKLQWTAARKHPRVYGERVEHNVTGAIATITRLDVSPVLAEELRRLGERYAVGTLAPLASSDDPLALPAAAGTDPPTGGE